MNRANTCWGVYREQAHSPNRVDDDAAIMKRVGEALAERGFDVTLVTADAVPEGACANVFVMCERGPILDRLSAMEKAGSVVVNASAAIRNTYRHRMAELFVQHNVLAPVSRIVATDANKPRLADRVWVKRYDFHATQSDDVIYAASEAGWRDAVVSSIGGVLGMVPQGLVLLTSLVMATAVVRLGREQALVQELSAVELLARVDVLLLDKTGTLTTGEMLCEEIIIINVLYFLHYHGI